MEALPYVRCVGMDTHVYQHRVKKAYDYRMIFIISGEGEIMIGNQEYVTRENQIYVIHPGTRFRVCSGISQKIAVVNFDGTFEYSHISNPVLSVDEEVFDSGKIMHTSPLPFCGEFLPVMNNECAKTVEQMYNTYLRSDILPEHKSMMLGSQLMYIWMRVMDFSYYRKSETKAALIYAYIIDNACSDLKLNDVANSFNFSTSYIEKTLRKNYHTSFKQLIIGTRLKKAVWLLENSSLSCSEIASQLGFYSSQHFSKMFKDKYGKNPTEIKNFTFDIHNLNKQ